jgi:hypothetical protein
MGLHHAACTMLGNNGAREDAENRVVDLRLRDSAALIRIEQLRAAKS